MAEAKRARKTIAERVRNAVHDDVTTHPLEGHIGALRENWRRQEDYIRRSLLLLAAVAVAFELAIRATIENISLLGIDIADISLPVVFMPTVFAFLAYEALSGTAVMVEVILVHDAFMREAYPPLHREGLHLHVGPHNLPLLADLRWRLRGRPRTRRESYLRRMTVFRIALVASAIVLFQLYAIYRVAFDLPSPLSASTFTRLLATLLTLTLFVPCVFYAIDFGAALRGRFRTQEFTPPGDG